MDKPQDNLCSFCHKPFDPEDRQQRPIYNRLDKRKFHPLCRVRITNLKKTLEEVKELNENLQRWLTNFPDYQFDPANY